MNATEVEQLLAGMEMQAIDLRDKMSLTGRDTITLKLDAAQIGEIERATGIGTFQRWLDIRNIVIETPPVDESTLYIVALDTSTSFEFAYGPFRERDVAEQFAEFLTREVDPATVHELRDPARELLNFWIQQRNGWTAPTDPKDGDALTQAVATAEELESSGTVMCPHCPDWAMVITSHTEAAAMFKCSRCGYEGVAGSCGRCGFFLGHASGCLP